MPRPPAGAVRVRAPLAPTDHHHHQQHLVRCATMQEFNLEKLQLLEAEKAKIRKEYERKESQIDTKKKM